MIFLLPLSLNHYARISYSYYLNYAHTLHGIPIAPEKTCGPATTLSFAGIELDSVSFEARLPLDKTDKCLSLIANFLTRKKVTLKEIQSLTGMLNFACLVVVPGKAFLRRLIDLTVGAQSPCHYIRIHKEVKAVLRLCQSFLTGFNGRSFFLQDLWYSSDKLELFTDAAGSLDLGQFSAKIGAMGNGLIIGYTRTLLCLSFIQLFLVCIYGAIT